MLSGIGHLSQRWAPFLDRHGTQKIEVRFPAKTCQECVARAHCTTGARGTYAQAPAGGKHIRRWRAADRNNIPPHSSKHMRSVLVSKGRFHKERVGPGCDGVPIAGSERHICIMYRLRLESMCSASSRIFMHRLKASLRVLNVEPPPLLVSRRWLDGDVQMSEQHFPTESSITGAFALGFL